MTRRYDYDTGGPPAGVSFLMFLLAMGSLSVAGVYLKASTLHQREMQITAYEETIGNWKAFRPTFARLSVNVTAFFGVAPVNTTDPGLDTDPSPPGAPVSLAKLEEMDPIFDEEGDAGGLPEYDPLKFEKGVIPPPWRTATRSPPPEVDSPEENGENGDSEDHSGEPTSNTGNSDPAEHSSGLVTHDDDGEGRRSNGGNGRRDRQRRRLANVTKKTQLNGGARVAAAEEIEGDTDAYGRWTPPHHHHHHHHQSRATSITKTPASAQTTTATTPRRVLPARAAKGQPGEEAPGISGSSGSSRSIHMKQPMHDDAKLSFNQDARETTGRTDERLLVGDEGVEEPAAGEGRSEAKEMDDGGGAAATLPPDFIPNVAFANSTSIRFVFTARLDPAPPSSSGNGNGKANRNNRGNDGHNRYLWPRRGKHEHVNAIENSTEMPPVGVVDAGLETGAGQGRRRGNNHIAQQQTTRSQHLSLAKWRNNKGGGGKTNSHPTSGNVRLERLMGEEESRTFLRRLSGGYGNEPGQSEPDQSKPQAMNGGRKQSMEKKWKNRQQQQQQQQQRQQQQQPIVRSLETEWAPLTRIRLEHAPMPAPETKCMQVFGGVHNYKTKMCEVYERLSRVCVQVYVDESSGEISFAQVPQRSNSEGNGAGGSKGADSSGSGGGGATEVARYGCDPRTAWSPWSYSVLPVEGRTVLDVVPPSPISFVETLVTVRSNLDPFIHVEALTYAPPGGGSGIGSDSPGTGGGDGGVAGGADPGAGGGGGGAVLGGGDAGVSSSGGGFLTFGLSSRSCAAFGFMFLAIGLLLLVQPLFALKRWYRENGDGVGNGSGGRNHRQGGGSSSQGKPMRRVTGQWRYGQVETAWEGVSDISEEQELDESTALDDQQLDQLDDDDWGSEGEWEQQDPVGMSRKVLQSQQPLHLRRRAGSGGDEDVMIRPQRGRSNSPLRTRLPSAALSNGLNFGVGNE